MAKLGLLICIPFAWLVRMFYTMTDSYGLALILFTLIIKLIMLPFQMKSKKSMLRMSRMSGKIQEIQKKYANNPMKLNEETQKLYAEEGVSPMSGCLWSFLPLPILIALYSIIRQPITHFMMIKEDVLQTMIDTVAKTGAAMGNIVKLAEDGSIALNAAGEATLQTYGQINLVRLIAAEMPEYGATIDGWVNVNYNFLGLDLTTTPNAVFGDFSFTWAVIGLILIPVVSGVLSLLQSKISMAGQQGAAAASSKSMMLMMPLMSVYIGFIMPAALGVYWIAQSAFSIVQEFFMNKFYMKKIEAEEAEREAQRLADRQKRQEEGRKQQELQKKLQQETHKQTLKEKQQAAQEAKVLKAAKATSSTTQAGRVGDRPYARGRAYKEDRYDEEK